MSEAQFHEQVDDLFLQVEEILDEAESDIDYVNTSGLLTISCENASQITGVFGRRLALWTKARQLALNHWQ